MLLVNALTDSGYDDVVDTVRVHVQAQWFGGLLDSLIDNLWALLLAVLYCFEGSTE